MNVKMKLIHHALLLLYALTLKVATNASMLIPTSWQKMEDALVMVVNLLPIKTFSAPFYNTVKNNQIAFYQRADSICEKSLHNDGHKDTDRFCK